MPKLEHSSSTAGSVGGGGNGVNNGGSYYTWHLSLRLDRPIEGCTTRAHAYMYTKKVDERSSNLVGGSVVGGGDGVALGSGLGDNLSVAIDKHTHRSFRPPPTHEFHFRWYRGPPVQVCGNDHCPRSSSFHPIDWTKYAMNGGLETVRGQQNPCHNYGSRDATVTSNILVQLQCVSSQSSLFQSQFCNAKCFLEAWRHQQHTLQSPRLTSSSRSSGSFYDRSDDVSVASMGSAGSGPYSKSPAPVSPSLAPQIGAVIMSSPEPQDGSNNDGNRSRAGSYAATTPSHGAAANANANPYSDTVHGEDWVEISRSQYYVPTELDVGRKLSLEAVAISTQSGKALMQRVAKTDLVLSRPPDPLHRSWVHAKTTNVSANGGARFRMVSYNVLAEIYATQQQYPYCDFWALSSDYRFQNILREILEVNPDVVCLQEVQADHYENYIYTAFSDAGYEGVYKSKTRAAMGLAGKVDGCALFWRRSKFLLSESYSIELNELAQRHVANANVRMSNDECQTLLGRLSKDNIAQLVVLDLANPTLPTRSNRDPINQVCIANTHLYSHKDFPDVKLWQTWQLLQELETFIYNKATNLPLVLCGDLNSTPDTAVYNLLMHQAVHPGHPDLNMGGDTVGVLPQHDGVQHSFQLGSAYAAVCGEEPKFTNYTTQFKGTLDYIWYSANHLRALSVAQVPTEEEILEFGQGMPSAQHPSDHIMMVADLQILGRSQ